MRVEVLLLMPVCMIVHVCLCVGVGERVKVVCMCTSTVSHQLILVTKVFFLFLSLVPVCMFIDIDECQTGGGNNCTQTCSSTVESFKCGCI